MSFASENFRHVNLQQVPLCGTFRNQRFFIVQECPYTLTQYIEACSGKVAVPIALHIVCQMLDALDFLHQIQAQEEGTKRTCATHDYLIPNHVLLTDDGAMPTGEALRSAQSIFSAETMTIRCMATGPSPFIFPSRLGLIVKRWVG